MSKFKVGDVVIRINEDWQDVKVGETYIISETGINNGNIRLKGHYSSYTPINFELAKNHIVKQILKDL